MSDSAVLSMDVVMKCHQHIKDSPGCAKDIPWCNLTIKRTEDIKKITARQTQRENFISFHSIYMECQSKAKSTLSPHLALELLITVVPASIVKTREKNDHRLTPRLSQRSGTVDRLLWGVYGTGVIHRSCCPNARGSSSSLSSPSPPSFLTPDSRSICHLEVLC